MQFHLSMSVAMFHCTLFPSPKGLCSCAQVFHNICDHCVRGERQTETGRQRVCLCNVMWCGVCVCVCVCVCLRPHDYVSGDTSIEAKIMTARLPRVGNFVRQARTCLTMQVLIIARVSDDIWQANVNNKNWWWRDVGKFYRYCLRKCNVREK